MQTSSAPRSDTTDSALEPKGLSHSAYFSLNSHQQLSKNPNSNPNSEIQTLIAVVELNIQVQTEAA